MPPSVVMVGVLHAIVRTMKDYSIGPLLLVIVLGSASAAVTSSLLSPDPVDEVISEVSPSVDLVAQLDALREENAALSSRLMALELRPIPSERVPAQASLTPAFEEEVRAFMKEVETDTGVTPVALQLKVQDALSVIREQEETQRQQVKRQQRDEWIASTIQKIAPELDLNQFQIEEMQRTWTAKSDADAELTRLWKSGDRANEDIGEIKRSNEERHQVTLQGFLSGEQYESYTAIVRRWRGNDK